MPRTYELLVLPLKKLTVEILKIGGAERKVYDSQRSKSLTSTPVELGRLIAAPTSIALHMGDSFAAAIRLACAFGMRMFSMPANGARKSNSSFCLRDHILHLATITPLESRLCN